MDYYDILNIDKNSSLEEIKVAYKNMSKTYHPDKICLIKGLSYNEGMKKIILINEAYKALIDPKKRYELDKNPKKAQKEIKNVEKHTETVFEKTIRYKIEQRKIDKIKSIRERAEETFSTNKSLLRDALLKNQTKTESLRDRIEKRKLEPDKPIKIDNFEKEIPILDTQIEEDFKAHHDVNKHEDYFETHREEEITKENAQEQTIDYETHEIQYDEKNQDKQQNSDYDYYDKMALFYKAVKLMDKKKYKNAMEIFIELIPNAESYPYTYIIKACQCGFFLDKNNFIHEKTIEAMNAYISSKWLTFLIDKPENQIFKLLLELFFHNFALCTLDKKIDLSSLLKAENEVFYIVKELSKTNPDIIGFASLYSSIAYSDLTDIYKDKTFLFKALDKLNYVPEKLYERKFIKRINKTLKHFFKRKEIRQFRMLYPVLRAKYQKHRK